MTYKSSNDAVRIYDAVPQLRRFREDVLLGDVWKQPEMSYRDRVLVTISVLCATNKPDELKLWMRRGVEAGALSLDDLRGFIMQVALYAGYPSAIMAGKAALDLLDPPAADSSKPI